MAIDQGRMLGLLAAAEDALGALARVEAIIARERGLVALGNIGPDDALANLELLLSPDALLDRPVDTKVAVAEERARWSPARVHENDRRRARAKGKRQRERSNGDEENTSSSD